MIKFLTLLILLTFSTVIQSSTGDWGSIAFGKGADFIAYGSSTNKNTEQEATDAALASCLRQTSTCGIAKTFKNKCVSVHVSDYGEIVFSINPDADEADKESKEYCETIGGCTKILMFCSGNQLKDYI